MKDQFKNLQNNNLLIIFIVIQIIFIVMAVISIKGLFKDERIDPDDISRQPSISIESVRSKIPVLSSTAVENIEHELLRFVKNSLTDVNFAQSKAILRDESIHTHYFETEKIGEVNFIVDIPDLEQTYQVFYEYSPDPNNSYLEPDDRIIVLCVEPSEVKYQSFDCLDVYSQGTRNVIVQKYLNFADFNNFYAEISDDDYNTITVNLNEYEETDGKAYIEETKAIVRALGSSPELFTYKIVQPEIPTIHSH